MLEAILNSISPTMLFFLTLWALCLNALLAASLPQRFEPISSLATSSPNLLSPAVLVQPGTNSSFGNRLQISCDAKKYGKNLKVNSCRNIFTYMTKDETQWTFAERDSGVPFDVPLPLRTFSSEIFLDSLASWRQCPAAWPAGPVDSVLTRGQQTTDCAPFSHY